MALRAESVGLALEGGGSPAGLSPWDGLAGSYRWKESAWSLFGVAIRLAINDQLRTGTDKGNPTV